MLLKNNGITDLDSWKKLAPPKRGDFHWKEGRSAMELARYITSSLPDMPDEIEKSLLHFTDESAEFEWYAEYVTDFCKLNLGTGEGRNHDAFLFNSDIVVAIEAKADEPLGSQLVGEALKNASDNKQLRINGMCDMIFGDVPENHQNIRYQLLTASSASLLEAKEKNIKNAFLMIIVFKKKNCFSEDKIAKNNIDISNFLAETSAAPHNDYYIIPTHYGKENGIDLYFKKIEINLD